MRDTRAMAKWAGLTILAGAAAALAACGHDDHNNNGAATTPPPAVVQSTDFEAYAKSTFMNGSNTTPLDPSASVFTFGVNSDPTAFDDLLM